MSFIWSEAFTMKTLYSAIGILCLAISFILTGCGGGSLQGKYTDEEMSMIPIAPKYNLPEASGGYTLRIYSETISVDEILGVTEKMLKPYAAQVDRATFKAESIGYVREAIRGKTVDILLYQEARKDAPENIDDMLEKSVESEIARFVSGYNNNYALAEKAIKEMGMDWKSFREYQKKLIMTQSYISSSLNKDKRFSHQELVDYYELIKEKQFTQIGLIEFSLIDIIPDKLTSDQVAEGQSNEAAAAKLAEEAMAKLKAGEDFAAIAEAYSHTMAVNGGKWTPHTIGSGSLPKPYDMLEDHAVAMTTGQIKGPITADGHIFILKLDRIQHGQIIPFDEVKKQIEQRLQFQYRNEQYQELVQKLIQKADFVQLERFSDFCTDQAYNRWGRDQ